MLKLILLTLTICAVSMLFLSVGVLFRRDGKFRSLHIGQSPEMRRKGIHCVQSMDRMMRREKRNKVPEREF